MKTWRKSRSIDNVNAQKPGIMLEWQKALSDKCLYNQTWIHQGRIENEALLNGVLWATYIV